jgi:hypothetical protein
MRRTLFYSAFVLAAIAAAGFVMFRPTARQMPAGQFMSESFNTHHLRSFESVPLETVSETSSNASIGDLNSDGHPDIVLVKGDVLNFL